MTFFNRLTDIVTCNISQLLEGVDDRSAALHEIIREMQEGVAGAERSTRTAERSVGQLREEIASQEQEVGVWVEQAKAFLAEDDEDQARHALRRKHEVEHLVAALREQLRAAEATRTQLHTTLQALRARLADAQRRLSDLGEHSSITVTDPLPTSEDAPKIEAELEDLRRSLGRA